jgi:lysophospholipase L1-like esterase
VQQKVSITGAQFCGALLVSLAVLATANFVVARLTAQSVSRRLLLDAQSSPSATVIALGNSLMRSGFIADVFSPPPSPRARSAAINLAMGASTPPEQLLLLRAALRSMPNARLLLYGFYDFQLTDAVEFRNVELIGNHDILYYDEPDLARRFYQMSPYDAAAFSIDRHLPLLAERGAVWAKVELLRRALGQQGMPPEARSQFGRAADFTLLEAKNRQEFEQHCALASEAPLNAPVREIIREAHDRGLRVVFIVMPLPPRHIRLFYDTQAWASYQQHVEKLLADQGVAYLDASRLISDPGKFGDALHLSESGAQEFSRRLAGLCADPAYRKSCGQE